MRLPTEAEWEYAARAGTAGARYGDLDEIAWYKGNGNGPHDVGTKRANPWKLYDMLGNVWEWVGDWYDEHYYAEQDVTDPVGPPSGKFRAQHGGSWLASAGNVRVSSRGWGAPGDHDGDTGFRCVGE